MIEILKKKSFKSSLSLSLILLAVGIALAVAFCGDAFSATTGYVDFTTLAPEEIKNQLVDVELVQNYGCYMEEYEENTTTHARTTTDYYYVIYTGASDDLETDYKYLSIKVGADKGAKMDEMTENTYNGVISSPLQFSGKIEKLDEEEYEFFHEFWIEMGFTEDEISEMTLPYYINAFDSKTSQSSLYIVAFIGGIFLIVWSVVRMIKGASGAFLKKFREDITGAGYTETALESDFHSATPFGKKDGIKVGRQFTYVDLNTAVPRAIPNTKIIWAYQNTTTHRTNGIKTGTSYSVMFYVEGYKNAFNVNVPNEATAQELLKKINTMFPWVVVGYSEELKKLFTKDHAQFLALRYNTVEHVAVEPGFEEFNGQFSTPEN